VSVVQSIQPLKETIKLSQLVVQALVDNPVITNWHPQGLDALLP
jgi:hypothetical protein